MPASTTTDYAGDSLVELSRSAALVPRTLFLPCHSEPSAAAQRGEDVSRNLLSPARRFNRVGPDTLVPRL
jgi:hypothetical protein